MLCSFSIFESPTPKSSIGTFENATMVECKGPSMGGWMLGELKARGWKFEMVLWRQCFLQWSIFAKFRPKKYDFNLYKGIFHGKNDPNSPCDFKKKKHSNHQIFMKHSSKQAVILKDSIVLVCTRDLRTLWGAPVGPVRAAQAGLARPSCPVHLRLARWAHRLAPNCITHPHWMYKRPWHLARPPAAAALAAIRECLWRTHRQTPRLL
jgi:hypothetical protein